ncbi:MAG TPA: dihydrofolate reductase family protein [Streptosporangiaceae bacterium]
MRKLSVSTLVTLDGVIQDPGGFGETANGGWAGPYFNADSEQDALEHLRAAEYFLIGRVTYELLSKAWGNNNQTAYQNRMNEIPKLVASNTLTGPLPWNATAVNGDVAAEIARLKREPGGEIEVYGSATLVQTLMRHDLIDEYRIAVYPIVLGGGTQLFPQGAVNATLRLTGTRTLDSGVVSLTYAPKDRS